MTAEKADNFGWHKCEDEKFYINQSFSVQGYDLHLFLDKLWDFGAALRNETIDDICKTYMLFVSVREKDTLCNLQAFWNLYCRVHEDAKKFAAILAEFRLCVDKKRNKLRKLYKQGAENVNYMHEARRFKNLLHNCADIRTDVCTLIDLCRKIDVANLDMYAPWRFSLWHLATKLANRLKKVLPKASSRRDYDKLLRKCGGVDFSKELVDFDALIGQVTGSFVCYTPTPVDAAQFELLRKRLLSKTDKHTLLATVSPRQASRNSGTQLVTLRQKKTATRFASEQDELVLPKGDKKGSNTRRYGIIGADWIAKESAFVLRTTGVAESFPYEPIIVEAEKIKSHTRPSEQETSSRKRRKKRVKMTRSVSAFKENTHDKNVEREGGSSNNQSEVEKKTCNKKPEKKAQYSSLWLRAR